jgi:MFS family permease
LNARVRLLRQRDVALTFTSTALSSMGDYLALLALTIKVHDLTGSGWAVGALLLSGLVPLVILSPVAGLLVDRVETVRVLVVTAVAQAGIATALAFAGGLPMILVLSFLLGAGFAITQPALFAMVPRVAGEDRITEANALLEVARWGGATLGPLVGGGLAAGLGTRTALLADAASFVLVAGASLALRARRPPQPPEPGVSARGEARAGMVLLAGDRLLLLVVSVLTGVVLFAAIDNVAEVFFAKDDLGAGDAGYGGMIGAWTLGMVLGSTLIGRRVPAPLLAPALLLASVAVGAAVTLTAAFPAIALAIAMYLCGGLANGVVNVSVRSLIHHRVPDRLRGRAFSAFFGVASTAQILAMGLGGGLVALFEGRGSLLVAGVGSATVGLLGLAFYSRLPAAHRAVKAAADEAVVEIPEAPVGPVLVPEPIDAQADTPAGPDR